MSDTNVQTVNDFCHSLPRGDSSETLAYLAEDVVYHNMPWEPVTGHVGVWEVLGPFLGGDEPGMKQMDILDTAASGDIVMNTRSEVWELAGVRVVLPVAGFFRLRDGLIVRWDDYWDTVTMQPLLDAMAG